MSLRPNEAQLSDQGEVKFMLSTVAEGHLICKTETVQKFGGIGNVEEEHLDSLKNDNIVREIIEHERSYFFEKRNVKTERQRKLRDIIERYTKPQVETDDS